MGQWGVPTLSICRSLLDLLWAIAQRFGQSQFVSIGCGDGSLEAALGAFTHTKVIGVDLTALADNPIPELRALRHVEYTQTPKYTCIHVPDNAVLMFVFPVLGLDTFCQYATSFHGIIVLVGDDTCDPSPYDPMPGGWHVVEMHEVLDSRASECKMLVLARA